MAAPVASARVTVSVDWNTAPVPSKLFELEAATERMPPVALDRVDAVAGDLGARARAVEKLSSLLAVSVP